MADRRENDVERALESIDESKRDSIRKLVAGAFVTPVVASFAINSLAVTPAFATNSSGSGH